MKNPIALLFTLLLASLSLAEEQLGAERFADEPLTVTAAPGTQNYSLVEIAAPNISSAVYALQGKIRYENVEGDGYLQLDNHFGAGEVFHTRSVAPMGPLGKVSGSSDWRQFVLPFNASGRDPGESQFPEKLSLRLHLPGNGTVSISNVVLHQFASGEDPLLLSGNRGGQLSGHSPEHWFSSRTSGLLGGIGGGVLGLWGALIGILAGRGKARGFVLGSTNALLVIALASIVTGVVAMTSGQPYAVYYPLLLIGVIIGIVIGFLRGRVSNRYEQLELKRMQSMDA